MSQRQDLPLLDLSLDLNNYRTRKQPNEEAALNALIAVNPGRFWSLTSSLIETGYLPTENVIVLKSEDGSAKVVREGNRRVGALKLIHGLIPASAVDVPPEVAKAIAGVSAKWRQENQTVPSLVFEHHESDTVRRIVALVHGKSEAAGREHWSAMARARLARDEGTKQPALDLLESYLDHAKNATAHQKEEWAGHFPLTNLEEVAKKLAPRLGAKNAPDLAMRYPNVDHRAPLDAIIRDIGTGVLTVTTLRALDFEEEYGIPETPPASGGSGDGKEKGSSAGSGGGSSSAGSKVQKGEPKAAATDTPASVKRVLKSFKPLGKGREKVVTLKNEACRLNIAKTPLAFCFVLRSMFELSAKAYCKDHNIDIHKGGMEKNLLKLLRDAFSDMEKQLAGDKAAIKQLEKRLHGPMTELAGSNSLLSVTSMNQLVHNPSFSVTPKDVCTKFHNVFPLLLELNQ
jgi:hypothetical protein